MSNKVELDMNARPDAYGFIYGRAFVGETVMEVNLMPPVSVWAGDMKLQGYEPDKKDWVVYADGEEVARISHLEGIEKSILLAIEQIER